MNTLQIKRAYEPAEKSDGTRILVNRLWPRGLRKEEAHIDHWMKQVAPSVPLRKWFNHDPAKWEEFQFRYLHELKENPAVNELHDVINKDKVVTLIYAAHDTLHNHALVLLQYLKDISK